MGNTAKAYHINISQLDKRKKVKLAMIEQVASDQA
jgi:hypothetical protein